MFKDLGRDVVLDEFIKIIEGSRKIQKMQPSSLAFHVVLIHFSKDLNQVLLYERSSNRSNAGKYDFGCVHLKYNRNLRESIKEYYSKALNTENYTILEESNGHPVPVSVYTYEKSNKDIVNGLIFCAKLTEDLNPSNLKIDGYNAIKWMNVKDILNKEDRENNLFEGSVVNIRRAQKLIKESEKTEEDC